MSAYANVHKVIIESQVQKLMAGLRTGQKGYKSVPKTF